LKEREVAIKELVEPLRLALERTEAQVQSLERERRDAFASLRVQIETLAGGHAQLQRETRALVTALRRPEVRGRWGEITLRRVVELAGLSAHCDFTEQQHIAGPDGVLRPDLVVHMPDGRDLVIDVKTPLDAYLGGHRSADRGGPPAAAEAPCPAARGARAPARLQSLLGPVSNKPEFAVLFLPGDQFLSAALAERPELMDNALKAAVIIATPSTLIALLKSVAYGWRQAAVAQNAALIRDLGQELYSRFGAFTGHLGKVGQRLGGAIEAYNAAVGSLERQVLPQARRFTDLGVTADNALPMLEPLTQLARATTSLPGADLPPAGGARVTALVSSAVARRLIRARSHPPRRSSRVE
jgi:DNA recombination protein RmuC